MTIQAMTIEKLKFSLPAVFTIGPRDDPEALRRYATFLNDSDRRDSGSQTHVLDITKGIIEGETRSIVSNMTMEELFKERIVFKERVLASVQGELEQFGLRIYNANVKELQDGQNSEYFATLSRKAHEGALNQARVDVAHARAKGEIGEAEMQSHARQEIAKIHAKTSVLETERKGEKAEADARLKTKEINIERALKLENINALRAAETRDAELQKDVEMARANMELERLRASHVVQAKIEREGNEQHAQAERFNEQQKADAERYHANAQAEAHKYEREAHADADKYRQQAEAEALRVKADAEAYERRAHADAALAAREAEAKGVSALAKAYGDMSDALGGPGNFLQYMMIKEGTYERLAQSNADAIRGLQPKISVWEGAGGGAGGSGSAAGVIGDIYKNLPPLLETVREQTG